VIPQWEERLASKATADDLGKPTQHGTPLVKVRIFRGTGVAKLGEAMVEKKTDSLTEEVKARWARVLESKLRKANHFFHGLHAGDKQRRPSYGIEKWAKLAA